MKYPPCHESLIELLQSHIARIADANEYMVTIKDAIAENKLEALQQSLSIPYLPIEAIEQLEQQRHRLLANYGYSEDREGFEECLRWCDKESDQVSGLNQQLIQGLVQLQHSIQVNNLLVNKGKDRVRNSISILTGLGAPGDCKTYSSSGKTLQSIGRRDIAVA